MKGPPVDDDSVMRSTPAADELRTRSGSADDSLRGSVIYMIRNTQQQLVALSGQADLKAAS